MKYAIWIVIATSWFIRGMNDCDAAQFRFSGQLSYVDDPSGVLPEEIHAGAPFAGTFFFGAADDLLPEDPSRGEYRFAGQSAGVRIEIGGQFVQSSNADPFALEVNNDLTYYPFDSPGNAQPAMDFFWIRDGVWTHSLGAEQVKIELFWINDDANVFSSDALPAVLDASDFKSLSRSVISPDLIPATIDITGGTPIDTGGIGQPGFAIRAQLQEIQVVPEPSSATVALIGCVAILSKAIKGAGIFA